MSDQKLLLEIVQTWDLAVEPEHRGFRCANCQEYMQQAWHHWLTEGDYVTPIHFCDSCQKKYEVGELEVKNPPVEIDRATFGKQYSPKTLEIMDDILENWDTGSDPVLKKFGCDQCKKDFPDTKGFHVWRNKEGLCMSGLEG